MQSAADAGRLGTESAWRLGTGSGRCSLPDRIRSASVVASERLWGRHRLPSAASGATRPGYLDPLHVVFGPV